jgi:ATP adenylyltransferase
MADYCIFCTPEQLTKTIPLNEDFYLNIDSFPVAPGHCEIIPYAHRESIQDLSPKEREAFWNAFDKALVLLRSQDFESVYKEIIARNDNPTVRIFCERILNAPYFGMPIDQFNTGNNDGIHAGRTVHHFHFHIIPRYEGDLEYLYNSTGIDFDEVDLLPRGGIRKLLPGVGDYKK